MSKGKLGIKSVDDHAFYSAVLTECGESPYSVRDHLLEIVTALEKGDPLSDSDLRAALRGLLGHKARVISAPFQLPRRLVSALKGGELTDFQRGYLAAALSEQACIVTIKPRARGNPNMQRKSDPALLAYKFAKRRHAGEKRVAAIGAVATEEKVSEETVRDAINKFGKLAKAFVEEN